MVVPRLSERVVLFEINSLSPDATLVVPGAGKGWVASHPSSPYLAVNNGGIGSCRVIDLNSKTGVQLINRSDFELGSSDCQIYSGSWAFSEDSKFLVSTPWKPPKFMGPCDAFLSVKSDEVNWVGFRKTTPEVADLRPFDNRFAPPDKLLLSERDTPSYQSIDQDPLRVVDGNLHGFVNGEYKPLTLDAAESSKIETAKVISVSLSRTSAAVLFGDRVFLVTRR